MAAKKKTKNEAAPEETTDESTPLPPTPTALDLDSASDRVSKEQLDAMLGSPQPVNKPDISRLPDALVCGKPVFGPGDKIVVERYATCLTHRPYLDTRTYKVLSVDTSTGKVVLWDEALNQYGSTNYVQGSAAGYVFKMAMGNAVATKKKRGRPRKNPIVPVTEGAAAGDEPKRGRGRPKGSKNRPKEEVRAEKAAKREAGAQAAVARKKKSP